MSKQQTIETLTVVALRGMVPFPGNGLEVNLGRAATKNAVTDRRTEPESDFGKQGDAGDVFLVCQRDSEVDEVREENLYGFGVIASVRRVTERPDGTLKVRFECKERAYVREIYYERERFVALVSPVEMTEGDKNMEEALFSTCKNILRDLEQGASRIKPDVVASLEAVGDSEELINRCGLVLQCEDEKRERLLEETRVNEALSLLAELLNYEFEVGALEAKVNEEVRKSMDKGQKDYYLRERIRAMHKELGDDEDERDELERRIDEKNMPDETKEKAKKELSRMGSLPPSSPDYNVSRVYIDWILDLPWSEMTCDNDDLEQAEIILNEDHYGLEKIKERIVEYLAVMKLTGGLKAPILCFVGPPGVGKTSVATSIARALGRKFVRMSLGGVSDEAEIRGHRKTYIGAMPGRIINGIKQAGSSNPVFLLDEIDKLSHDIHGDPSSALLEVLDPEQNATFRDRYIELPYDLSHVLFITTANSLDTVPRPLLDRMEVVEISGYTQEEKFEIAKRYLVKKCRERNGLSEDAVEFSDDAIREIIDGYTLEAGVRSLERGIDSVCRKAAVKIAEGRAEKIVVGKGDVEEFLGARKYEMDEFLEEDEVGAATGLAWTSVGGVTLTVEVSTARGKGNVTLTGQLGDVMKESAKAAISCIRSRCDEYGIDDEAFETTDIHIHVPEGATPKDGPSAGITMATAILSAFTKKPVKRSVAMTGEITLRGKVLKIGGLKEKALAAYRVGVTDVVIPAGNQRDLEEIPEEVREKLNFIPATDVDTVFRSAIKW